MISSHSQGFYCSITSYMKCTTHHTRLHVLVLITHHTRKLSRQDSVHGVLAPDRRLDRDAVCAVITC